MDRKDIIKKIEGVENVDIISKIVFVLDYEYWDWEELKDFVSINKYEKDKILKFAEDLDKLIDFDAITKASDGDWEYGDRYPEELLNETNYLKLDSDDPDFITYIESDPTSDWEGDAILVDYSIKFE